MTLVELARSQPSKVEDLFFDFIETRKKEGVGGSTIHMARDAVKLLLEMNDIEKVNWKKIDRLIPRARRHGSDRPTHSRGDPKASASRGPENEVHYFAACQLRHQDRRTRVSYLGRSGTDQSGGISICQAEGVLG